LGENQVTRFSQIVVEIPGYLFIGDVNAIVEPNELPTSEVLSSDHGNTQRNIVFTA